MTKLPYFREGGTAAAVMGGGRAAGDGALAKFPGSGSAAATASA